MQTPQLQQQQLQQHLNSEIRRRTRRTKCFKMFNKILLCQSKRTTDDVRLLSPSTKKNKFEPHFSAATAFVRRCQIELSAAASQLFMAELSLKDLMTF